MSNESPLPTLCYLATSPAFLSYYDKLFQDVTLSLLIAEPLAITLSTAFSFIPNSSFLISEPLATTLSTAALFHLLLLSPLIFIQGSGYNEDVYRRQMKVGIDTFGCNAGVSGVGVYLKQILKRIPPSGALFELFGWEYERYMYKEAAEKNMEFSARCRISGETSNLLWHIFKYPEFAHERGYDVCFFPAAHRRLPNKSPCPTIGTIHDMAAYWGTRRTREHLGAVLRLILPDSLRRLERVIAVSSWVKQELIDVARVKESRIDVVPNGVDHDVYYPRPAGDESVLRIKPFTFTRPYILYAARLEYPVKNHAGLIRAFEIFKQSTKLPHRLVFAGANSKGADKIQRRTAASPQRADILFAGPFPSESLPELVAGADMVVIPSFYEGFGQAAIEAMASGIPVACARAASLPEIAGNSALYFDPFDSEDMADRMVSLAYDEALYKRCREAGLEHAKNFSWDNCAERTLQIIQETA
jgi:glycosyltransferase involved in cell wall biosynthesis